MAATFKVVKMHRQRNSWCVHEERDKALATHCPSFPPSTLLLFICIIQQYQFYHWSNVSICYAKSNSGVQMSGGKPARGPWVEQWANADQEVQDDTMATCISSSDCWNRARVVPGSTYLRDQRHEAKRNNYSSIVWCWVPLMSPCLGGASSIYLLSPFSLLSFLYPFPTFKTE